MGFRLKIAHLSKPYNNRKKLFHFLATKYFLMHYKEGRRKKGKDEKLETGLIHASTKNSGSPSTPLSYEFGIQ